MDTHAKPQSTSNIVRKASTFTSETRPALSSSLSPLPTHPAPPQAMVAPSPFLSRSLVAARDKGSPTSLRASSAWSSLKAHVRSFVASNNNNTTPSPARAASTPHLVAIVGGAVGAVVVLAVVLALVHVLRVRRKVERLRRSTNVLGPGASSLSPAFCDGAC